MTQYRHQQVRADEHAADADLLLTQVDLHLVAWGGLVPHTGHVDGPLLAAKVGDHALHGMCAHRDASMSKLMGDHDGIAFCHAREELLSLGPPILIQAAARRSNLDLRSGLTSQIPAARIARYAELCGDSFRAPPPIR